MMLGLGLGLMRGRAVSQGSITGAHAQTIAVTSTAAATVADPYPATADIVTQFYGASGRGGLWDAGLLSSLKQDNIGTAVTAAGQSVYRWQDQSGGNYHMQESNSSHRPLYGTDGTHGWLTFDGVDDNYAETGVGLSSTTAITAGIAFRKADDTENGYPLWVRADATATPVCYVESINGSGGGGFKVTASKGTPLSFAGSLATGEDVAVSWRFKGDGTLFAARKNGVSMGANITSGLGAGAASTFGAAAPVYMGPESSLAEFNGRIYRAFVLYRDVTTEEWDTLDSWLKGGPGL